jgi:protein SCO1/2
MLQVEHRLLNFLAIFLPALMVCTEGCRKAKSSQSLPDLGAVAEFSLKNQNEKTVTRNDLQGKVWVAGFIFTRCAGPCSQVTASMARLQNELSGIKSVVLVTFTVDPEHDTPKVLNKYGNHFGADPGRWSFLTGDKKALYGLIRTSFHLGVQETSGPDRKRGNEVIHSTKLALVDRRGHIRAYCDGTNAEELKKLRKEIEALAGETP